MIHIYQISVYQHQEQMTNIVSCYKAVKNVGVNVNSFTADTEFSVE